MNSKILIGLFVILAGLAVGWYVLRGNPVPGTGGSAAPTPEPSLGSQLTPAAGDGAASSNTGQSMEKGGIPSGDSQTTQPVATAKVSYTDSGFAPNRITVKQGTAVTFTNQSARAMWVASGVHPTHQLLPGFDELTSVAKGGTYVYTFVKVGTWQYHNHMNPTDLGYVVVTQ